MDLPYPDVHKVFFLWLSEPLPCNFRNRQHLEFHFRCKSRCTHLSSNSLGNRPRSQLFASRSVALLSSDMPLLCTTFTWNSSCTWNSFWGAESLCSLTKTYLPKPSACSQSKFVSHLLILDAPFSSLIPTFKICCEQTQIPQFHMPAMTGLILSIRWKETFVKMNSIHCTFLSRRLKETQSKILSQSRILDSKISSAYWGIFLISLLGLQQPLGLKITLSYMKIVFHF